MKNFDEISKLNSEGYPDPTAYAAFIAIEREERSKRKSKRRRRGSRVKYQEPKISQNQASKKSLQHKEARHARP